MNTATTLDLSAPWRWLRKLSSSLPLGLAVLAASMGSARAESHAKETRSELVMASGTSHTCALGRDGTVKCWGSNSYGQLGNGIRHDAQTPTPVPGLTNVIALAAGDSHTCALLATGTIMCWGDNSQGQLGGGSFQPSVLPVLVSNIGGNVVGAIAVAAGAMHTCALLANGSVTCWGDNDQYQLGNGTAVDSNAPSGSVAMINDATAITAGTEHTCALRNSGQVWCWGRNGAGQVGDGTTIARSSPVASSHIAQPSGEQAVILGISAGRSHTCALAVVRGASGVPTSRVECWGFNGSGQLGTGTTTSSSVPVWASGVNLVQSVSASGDHTCALLAGGTLKCWGDNADGQTGDGTVGGVKLLPTAVSGATNVRLASLGYTHTCAELADGTVKCWGNNWRNQLGNGPFIIPNPPPSASASPPSVPVLSGVSGGPQIAAGADHACALLADGTAKCWGNNASGQLGNGTLVNESSAGAVSSLSNAVALCAGASHSCALLANGTAKCWGSNAAGQLGTGTTSSTPVSTPNLLVSGLANATGITCGTSHTCASIADGTTQCWGSSAFGQVGSQGTCGAGCSTPAPVMLDDGSDTVVDLGRSVAAGANHTCAVSATGAVTCWGTNNFGNLGDGTTTQRLGPVGVTLASGLTAKSLALGSRHTCAVIADGTVECWGYNASGGLGDTTTVQRNQPVNVAGFTGISRATSMASGGAFSCARMAEGTLKCWGNNASGQLGVASPSFTSTPIFIPETSVYFGAAVASGRDHTCGMFANGTAKCWGLNASGQLGNGTTVSSYLPGAVVGFP